MPTVTISEAEAQLSKLIDAAAAGEDVLIARDGKPVARLTALASVSESQEIVAALRARGFGALEGQGWIADDFDDPLPPEILAGFEGM